MLHDTPSVIHPINFQYFCQSLLFSDKDHCILIAIRNSFTSIQIWPVHLMFQGITDWIYLNEIDIEKFFEDRSNGNDMYDSEGSNVKNSPLFNIAIFKNQ